MDISKDFIDEQLKKLDGQREQAVIQIGNIDGAIQTMRFMLQRLAEPSPTASGDEGRASE